jgi:hypothetical protein
MAQSQSSGGTVSGSSEVLAGFYAGSLRTYGGAWDMVDGAGEIVGGGVHAIGGFEDLLGYENTAMSKSKEQLVRDIAKDMAGLGVKNVKTTGSVAEIVKSLAQNLPTAKKGSVVKDSKAHDAICRKLAQVLNKRLGQDVVDEKGDLKDICDGASKVLHSLSVGMHSEYLAVAASLRRLVKNLRDLQTFIQASHGKLMDRVKNGTDETLKHEAAGIHGAHAMLMLEINRRLSQLDSVLNSVVTPTDSDLVNLLTQDEDMKKLAEKIDSAPGTEAFASKIGFLFSGISNTAYMSHLVNKALKDIGMTTAEYSKLKDLKQLNNALEGLLKKDFQKANINELSKFMLAADVLRQNNLHQTDIVSYLNKKKGGAASKRKGRKDHKKSGAAPQRKKLDSRVKKLRLMKKALFSNFNNNLRNHYDSLMAGISAISKKVGTEIPLSDDLEKFVKALRALDDLSTANLYYALSGYANDIRSREIRDRFNSNLKHLSNTASALKSGSAGAHFKVVADNADAIVDMSDRYSDKFASSSFGLYAEDASKSKSKSGLGEFAASLGGEGDGYMSRMKNSDRTKAMQSAALSESSATLDGASTVASMTPMALAAQAATGVNPADALNNVGQAGLQAGGADEETELLTPDDMKSSLFDVENDSSLPPVSKSAYNLEKVKNELLYNWRVTSVRKNLDIAANEIGHYGEDYDKVVGEAIGKKLTKITDDYNLDLKIIKKDKTDGLGNGKVFKDEREYKDVLDLVKLQYETRRDTYKTIEAIDLYLKAFTDGAVKNTKNLKSVKKLIESVDNIARWFDDKSGNDLVNVFESFPGGYNDKQTDYNWAKEEGALKMSVKDKNHYYNKVAGLTKGQYPGNPYIGLNPALAKKALVSAEKAVEGLALLKNIMSIFTSIGDEFGGAELRKKTTMSVNQMYKNLQKFYYVSAFCMGLNDNTVGKRSDLYGNWSALGSDFNDFAPGVVGGAKKKRSKKSKKGRKRGGDDVEDAQNALNAHEAKPIMSISPDNMSGHNTERVRLEAQLNKAKVEDLKKELSRASDKSSDRAKELADQLEEAEEALAKREKAMGSRVQKQEDLANYGPAYNARKEDKIDLFKTYPGVSDDNRRRAKYYTGMNGAHMCAKDGSESIKAFFNPQWADEEDLVAMCIKAMAAKVFTVINMYNLLNRPSKVPLNSNPTRLIMGGSTLGGYSDTPEVISGAMELYIRLPLLVEFYRDLFSFDKPSNVRKDIRKKPSTFGDADRISLIPEIESIFGNLVWLIFEEAKYVQNGMYSENDINKLIVEINRIYGQFSGQKNPVSAVINAFVAEMNRRYGIVTREDYVHYKNELRKRRFYGSPEYKSKRVVDYSILPGEEEPDYVHSAPSDAYFLSMPNSTSDEPDQLQKSYYKKLVRDFRDSFEEKLEKADSPDFYRQLTFDKAIKHAKDELKSGGNAKDNQFKVVVRAMQGVGAYRQSGTNRLVAFHETVVVGCALLNGFYQTMLSFSEQIAALSKDTGRSKSDRLGELFESIYTYSQGMDKLVNVRFDGDKVFIDQSRARKLVEDMFQHLRKLLTKFKGDVINKELVAKYEDRSVPGSLYWLEEKLMDELMMGRKSENLSDDSADHVSQLNMLNQRLNTLVADLRSGENLSEEFRQLAYHGRTPIDGKNGKMVPVVPAENGIMSLLRHMDLKKDKVLWDPVYGSRMDIVNYQDDKLQTQYCSLVEIFNQLVGKYLDTFFDQVSNKIYLKTINAFAAGTFSQAVNQGQCFPDVREVTSDKKGPVFTENITGIAPEVPHDAVLFASLGRMMRTMFSELNRNESAKQYLVNDMSEIPLHMRERYRAEMPVFMKLFRSLIRRCEMMKNMMELVDSGKNLERTAKTAGIKSVVGVYAALPVKEKGESVRGGIERVCDSIIQGCNAMINGCRSTLRDVEDSAPVFLDTYKGSIKDYRDNYNREPLMPYSSMLVVLQEDVVKDGMMMPFSAPGSNKFKMLYATRKVLGRPEEAFSLKEFPGAVEIIQAHNNMTESRSQISLSEYEAFLQDATMTLRFLHDMVNYRCKFACDNRKSDVCSADLRKYMGELGPYAYKKKLDNVINLTESSFHRKRVEDIVSVLPALSTPGGGNREHLQMQNVLDMGIVPINPHAMLREVPLANIYNYSYTFEKQAANLFNRRTNGNNGVADGNYNLESSDSTGVLVNLLVHPYRCVSKEAYDNNVARLIRGDSGAGLGRPKFLGDQVFNKALFGELYVDAKAYPLGQTPQEGGPAQYRNARQNVDPRDDKEISYLSNPAGKSKAVIKPVLLGTVSKKQLQNIGYLRFNTKLVRDMFFLTNLYRVMRAKIVTDLFAHNTPVVNDLPGMNSDLTELRGNNVDHMTIGRVGADHDGEDANGNETFGFGDEF